MVVLILDQPSRDGATSRDPSSAEMKRFESVPGVCGSILVNAVMLAVIRYCRRAVVDQGRPGADVGGRRDRARAGGRVPAARRSRQGGGNRYAVTHGGVADYALVSEGTDFSIIGVAGGKAFFKITVFGDVTCRSTRPYRASGTAAQNPSAISRMAIMIQAVEDGGRIRDQNRYECAGGTVVPRSSIRRDPRGVPWKITEDCAAMRDLCGRAHHAGAGAAGRARGARALLAQAGLAGEVELYVYRAGIRSRRVQGGAARRRHPCAPTRGCSAGIRTLRRSRPRACGATSTCSTRCASLSSTCGPGA